MPLFTEALILQTPHILRNVSPERKAKLGESYRKWKNRGLRFTFGAISGGSICQVGYELLKDEFKTYGKQKIGAILVATGATVCSGGLVLVTNGTKVVKYANMTH